MKNSYPLIFGIVLFFTSCSEDTRDVKKPLEPTSIEMSTETEQLKDKENNKEKLVKNADSFIEKILGENKRKHPFGKANQKNISYLKIFEQNGLHDIIAYSDKRYPQKREPRHYEDFILFVLAYENNQNAENAYNALKKITQMDRNVFMNLDEKEKQHIRIIESSLKPGGMIYQKNNYLFSLVETCRETPIGGKWIDYENLFLEYIAGAEKEILVLNADCGNMEYREEKRNLTKSHE